MKFIPREYQRHAAEFAIKHPCCALFMDMGLGKTATVLLSMLDLMWNRFAIRRVLIIAPKRVATIVWSEEIEKWDEFTDFRECVLHGTQKLETLQGRARNTDIMIINYEGLPWLAENAAKVPVFDLMILDESTYVKNPDSKRFLLLASFAHRIPRRVILSGKPLPNGLQDLWSQYFILDGGERLGKNYKQFEAEFFAPVSSYSRKLIPYRRARKEIGDRVRDITLTMRRKDYLDMPDFLVNEIRFDMPVRVQKAYKELESKFFMDLPSGESLLVRSEAGLSMKLRQFLAGFVYTDSEGSVEWLHKERLKVLEEIREANPGKPLLIAIQFKEEVNLIRKHFKRDIPSINSDTSDAEGVRHIANWNKGELQELLVHPASVAHGLNMQFGGHLLVVYSQTWNLDHDDQLVKRLDRPGQKERVVVHKIIARNTIDETIAAALKKKSNQQETFLRETRAA